MLSWLLLFPALALEAGALVHAVNFEQSDRDLALFWVLHGGASVLIAVVVHAHLPLRYREPRWGVLALLASASFFMPFLGVLGMLVAMLVAAALPASLQYRPFAAVRAPEFVQPGHETAERVRVGGLRTMLLDEALPADVRLKSLIALQSMPVRSAGPMLRRLLADPSDDIRLVAYGILDQQEKRISGAIAAELARLERATEPAARLAALRALAEQYWELVYTGLAQGDLRTFVIGEGLKYIDAALASSDVEPGLWLLKGRLLHARRDLAGAAESYSIAVACGLPEARALPYLAQIAFDRHELDLVRQYLSSIAGSNKTPAMAEVMRFWSSVTRA